MRTIALIIASLLLAGCATSTTWVRYTSTGSGGGAFDRAVIRIVDNAHDRLGKDAVAGHKRLDAQVTETNGRVRHQVQYRSEYRY